MLSTNDKKNCHQHLKVDTNIKRHQHRCSLRNILNLELCYYLTLGLDSSVFAGGAAGSGAASGAGAACSDDPLTLSLADILSLPQLTVYSPDSLQFLTKSVRSFPFDFSS